MGNTSSLEFEQEQPDIWWGPQRSAQHSNYKVLSESKLDEVDRGPPPPPLPGEMKETSSTNQLDETEEADDALRVNLEKRLEDLSTKLELERRQAEETANTLRFEADLREETVEKLRKEVAELKASSQARRRTASKEAKRLRREGQESRKVAEEAQARLAAEKGGGRLELHEDMCRVQSELQEARTVMEDLRRRLTVEQEHNERLLQQVDQSSVGSDGLAQEMEKLRVQAQESRRMAEDVQARLLVEQEHNQGLRGQVERWSRTSEEMVQEMNRLHREEQETRAALEELRARREHENIGSVRKRSEEMAQELEQLKRAEQESKEVREELHSRLALEQENNAKLREQIELSRVASEQVTEEVNRLRCQNQDGNREIEELRSKLTTQQHSMEETEELQERLAAEQESSREITEVRDKLEAELNSTRVKLEEFQDRLAEEKENSRDVEELREKLAAEQENKEEITRLREKLEAQLENRREIENLRERLAEEQENSSKIKELQRRLEAEQEENAKLKGQVAGRAEHPVVAEEVARFRAEMSIKREARQRAMAALSTELERLRCDLRAERVLRENAERELMEGRPESDLEGRLLMELKTERASRDELEAELEEAKRLADQQLRQRLELEDLRRSYSRLTEENVRLQQQGSAEELQHLKEEVEDLRKRNQWLSEQGSRLEMESKATEESLRSSELAEQQQQVDNARLRAQVDALKEVISITKQMLNVREGQVDHLKVKVREIEAVIKSHKVGDTSGSTARDVLHRELRDEYQAQVDNIRALRSLYEERMALAGRERERLEQENAEREDRLRAEASRADDLQTKLAEAESLLEHKDEAVSSLQSQLDSVSDENANLASELTLINNVFAQLLVGGSTDVDLDRLTRMLQENHDLMMDITAKEGSNEAAATLPKLLLDLVSQLRDNQDEQEIDGSQRDDGQEASGSMGVQDVAGHLPKVWKVLLELLSHHATPEPVAESLDSDNPCYKSVDTPSGPRLVISVSKTFIRLKDLILEKKSLQRELTRLKQLNGHLESKLDEQECRLTHVSSELTSTWDVVERMRNQHAQLHTHEKILRFELQHKRKMLSELREELEYCREKWERARQKNSESEVECRKLRKEFAARRRQDTSDSLSNSRESGFSDEKESEDEEPRVVVQEEEDEEEEEKEVEKETEMEEESLAPTSDCSTVTLITLLKQQLAFFSRNLEAVTNPDVLQSPELRSIFSLPAIQVPVDSLRLSLCHSPSHTEYLVEEPSDETTSTRDEIVSTPSEQPQGDSVPVEHPSQPERMPEELKLDDSTQEKISCPSLTTVLQDETRYDTQQEPPQPPATWTTPEEATPVRRSAEEVLAARAVRLQRLEEQCQQLFVTVTRTSHLRDELNTRLEELHGQYRPPSDDDNAPATAQKEEGGGEEPEQ